MLPFSVHLKPGQPTHEQILAAVRDALASGQLRDGDPFPSTRDLAQSLRISPNAAQKVVEQLSESGLLARQGDSGFMVRLQASATEPFGRIDTQGALPTMIEGETPRPTQAFDAGASPNWPFLRKSGSPGDQLGFLGEYEVRRFIAQGGMGVVFEAQDPQLQRRVAIKVLAPHLAASDIARARFLREARSLAAVDHSNVLPVHSVGEEAGYPYLVMPLVQGESLQARLEREGALPIRELLPIALHVGRGLAAAHDQGLIHRDLKPDNVLLESPGERVWLADFGLARAREDENLTATSVVAATPRFASPEQVEGGDLTPLSDLFSFGSLLYAAATGRAPFEGSNVVTVLRNIVEKPVTSPRNLRPNIPEALEDLILQLLQKRPEDRPESARDVVNQLEEIQSRH